MIRTLSFLSLLTAVAATSPSWGMTIYSQSQSGGVGFPDSTPVVLTFTGAPPAASDATLELIATGGELANNNKRLEQLKVEGDTHQTPGQPAGWVLPVNYLDGAGATPPPVTILLGDLTGYVADGQVEVSVVRPGFIAGGTFDLVLSYTTAVPEPTAGLLALLGLLGIGSGCRRRC